MEIWKCINCEEFNEDEYTECKICGRVKPVAKKKNVSNKKPVNTKVKPTIPPFVSKFCNQCGKPYNKPISNFCSYCGKKRNK